MASPEKGEAIFIWGNMPKKSFYPIPVSTPYDGPGKIFLVCVPDDQLWMTAFRESVRALTKGRYWDRETGTITDAQAVGMEIYNSMITCDEIVTEMKNLVAAVVALSADNQTIINQQQNCCWINDSNTAVEMEENPRPAVPPDEGNPPPQSEPDWATRRCYGGYAYINLLVANLTRMMDLATAGIVSISAVLGIFLLGLGLLTTAGAIAVVGGLASQALAVWSAWRDLADVTFLDPVKLSLESDTAARARMACAFKNAVSQETLRDEVRLELDAQFGSLVGGLLINLVIESQMQALYNGQYEDDNGDIQVLDYSPMAAQNPDCSCMFDVLIAEEFDADVGHLDIYRGSWKSDYGGTVRLTANDVDVGAIRIDSPVWSAYGLQPGTVSNLRISFTARSKAGDSGANGVRVRVNVAGQGETEVLHILPGVITDVQAEDVFVDLTGTDVSFSGGGVKYIEVRTYSTGGSRSIQVDDLLIQGEIT